VSPASGDCAQQDRGAATRRSLRGTERDLLEEHSLEMFPRNVGDVEGTDKSSPSTTALLHAKARRIAA